MLETTTLNVILNLCPEIYFISYICYMLVTVFNNNKNPMLQYYKLILMLILGLILLFFQLSFLDFSDITNKLCYNFTWINSQYTIWSKIFITILIILVLLISWNKLKKKNLNNTVELPLIIAFSTLFIFILTSSYDFFGMYLAIEGLSLTLYTLAALLYQGVVALEAAIKYFSLGAISSGILLYGISIIFGIVGNLDFLEVQLFLTSNNVENHYLELKFALLCILFGFFFKLGAFPCHIWVADVYEGVWTPITAFFSIVIKASMFLFFLRLLFNVFFNILFIFQPLFLIISLGSMLIGSLGAIKQVRIKRFMAYTSITQVGFLFLGISSCNFIGLFSTLLYLIIYTIMSTMFFLILLNSEHQVTKKNLIYLSDFGYLAKYETVYIQYLSLSVLSMAGLPPLAGFWGKLSIYFAAVEAKLDIAVLFSMALSMISIYYYLNIIKYLWFEKAPKVKLYHLNILPKPVLSILLFVLGFSLVIIGFWLPTITKYLTSLVIFCIWL